MCGVFPFSAAARVTDKLEVAEVRSREYKAELQKASTKTRSRNTPGDASGTLTVTCSLSWGPTPEWLPGCEGIFQAWVWRQIRDRREKSRPWRSLLTHRGSRRESRSWRMAETQQWRMGMHGHLLVLCICSVFSTICYKAKKETNKVEGFLQRLLCTFALSSAGDSPAVESLWSTQGTLHACGTVWVLRRCLIVTCTENDSAFHSHHASL